MSHYQMLWIVVLLSSGPARAQVHPRPWPCDVREYTLFYIVTSACRVQTSFGETCKYVFKLSSQEQMLEWLSWDEHESFCLANTFSKNLVWCPHRWAFWAPSFCSSTSHFLHTVISLLTFLSPLRIIVCLGEKSGCQLAVSWAAWRVVLLWWKISLIRAIGLLQLYYLGGHVPHVLLSPGFGFLILLQICSGLEYPLMF